jgi:type I restriction enzyme M protein
MTTQDIRSKIDALWLHFYSGGIANPISVIEQISYLMFIRMLDQAETKEEKKAKALGKPMENPIFGEERKHLRWSYFKHLGGEEMLTLVRDKVFLFLREDLERSNSLGRFFNKANCLIPTPSLMSQAVSAIDELPLDQGDDTKGDLYEYMLSKLSTAGIGGQFRTPRQIIRAMVEMMDPKPNETICDPACGTAGFLVNTMEYLTEKYSTEELIQIDPSTGLKQYPGDQLEDYRAHIQKSLLTGFDFDETMLRIASMNLLLHGIREPGVHYQDTLSSKFFDNHGSLAADSFDLILANPPFAGVIDGDNVDASLKSKIKTKKSELLFTLLILRLLKNGGRCAAIVPEGVLFGSSKAHVGVRKTLVEDNQLEGVISLPSGVFKPYAGVQTAILIFTKAGRTDDVWFYKVEQDGYSLDDKRTATPDKNDLPDLVEQWKKRDSSTETKRTDKHFFVPKSEIVENEYDLSINRYAEVEYEEVEYAPPGEILGELDGLEQEIAEGIKNLKEMVG